MECRVKKKANMKDITYFAMLTIVPFCNYQKFLLWVFVFVIFV